MKIIKKAVNIGNGACVYVPREYVGSEVVVILPDSIDDIKKGILNRLIEFMPNILGVYLYGSYVRGEETVDSDVDLLVITKEKDDKIQNVLEDIDVRVVPISDLKKSIKNYPLLIVPILKEAKVLLNPDLLKELKDSKIDFKKFRWNFEDIKRIIKIVEGFVRLDDEDVSPSLIYSLIMRIRVCYLIECLLKNKSFNNKGVEELFLSYGLNENEIKRFFYIYRMVREKEKLIVSIKKEETLNLVNILKIYSKKLEHETKKKIGKGD